MKGLIEEFIETSAANYKEPQRKGTPKGDPIGFPSAKYNASLLALKDIDLQTQAKKLGVSYGLLKKWRSEAEFKNRVNAHCENFTVLFFRHLLDIHAENEKKKAEYLSRPLEEIANHQPEKNLAEFSRVADFSHYSIPLQKEIYNIAKYIFNLQGDYLLKKGIIKEEDELAPLAIKTFGFQSFLLGNATRDNDENRELLRAANRSIAKYIRDIILKPKLTEDDKKRIVYALHILDR